MDPWAISNFSYVLLAVTVVHSILGAMFLRSVKWQDRLLAAQTDLMAVQIEINNARAVQVESLAERVTNLEESHE